MVLNQIGVIGLGVMGANLTYNLSDHDHLISVYDRNEESVTKVSNEKNIKGYHDLKSFVDSLQKPRKILLMVNAGSPVDSVISELESLLSEGDIIVDGGNSYYLDTLRRQIKCKEKKIEFVGMGISGGAEGARYGASLMPSGNKEAIQQLLPFLKGIAATTQQFDLCVDYIGEQGSGHFIKMVHNGIEYADLQILCDAYAIMKHGLKMTNHGIAEVFESWQQTELQSYLTGIASEVLKEQDPLTGNDLIDYISDVAGSKGTGKWTIQYAIEENIPCSTLFSAVDIRNISQLSRNKTKLESSKTSLSLTLETLQKAVYASRVFAYMQGFSIMEHASSQYNWNLDFESISKIWGAGCIIQGQLINDINDIYKQETFECLSQAQPLIEILETRTESWRETLIFAMNQDVYCPVISSAYNDVMAMNTVHLSTNLLQGMRDYFGGHTYERVDREGNYHTNWNTENR
ncbi:MAG: NADP-dependent phosphogluconate dehydrogenase [Erysipelothrix sp.]